MNCLDSARQVSRSTPLRNVGLVGNVVLVEIHFEGEFRALRRATRRLLERSPLTTKNFWTENCLQERPKCFRTPWGVYGLYTGSFAGAPSRELPRLSSAGSRSTPLRNVRLVGNVVLVEIHFEGEFRALRRATRRLLERSPLTTKNFWTENCLQERPECFRTPWGALRFVYGFLRRGSVS